MYIEIESCATQWWSVCTMLVLQSYILRVCHTDSPAILVCVSILCNSNDTLLELSPVVSRVCQHVWINSCVCIDIYTFIPSKVLCERGQACQPRLSNFRSMKDAQVEVLGQTAYCEVLLCHPEPWGFIEALLGISQTWNIKLFLKDSFSYF